MTGLPGGWEWSTLGELCAKPQYGWTTKADRENLDGLKLLRTTDITRGPIRWELVPTCTEAPDDVGKYQLAKGDLVVSRAGSVGESALIESDPPPAVFASYLIRLRPMHADARYIKWFMQSPEYWRAIEDSAAGIALQNVNAKKLASIRVPVAPPDEQQRIVEAIEEQFSRLDAGVESLQRARRNLARFRAAVLKAGVEGRLTNTSSRNWPVVDLESVASLVRNGVFVSRPDQDTSGVPIFRISAVRPMSLNLGDVRFAHGLDEGTIGKYTVCGGDLLYTRYSGQPEYVGACAMVPGGSPRILHPDKLIRVVVDQEAVLPGFVELASSTGISLEFIRSRRHTTAGQTGIAGRDLKQMPLPLPPVSEQSRIVAEIQRHLSFVEVLEASLRSSIDRSQSLRRSILQKAFAGRLCNSLVRKTA